MNKFISVVPNVFQNSKEHTHTHTHIYIYIYIYRIRPLPSLPPPDFSLISLIMIIGHLTIFFLTIYFIFTYYRPLDDVLALVVENKLTLVPQAPIRSNTLYILHVAISMSDQEPTRWQHNRIYPYPTNPYVYTYNWICHLQISI